MSFQSAAPATMEVTQAVKDVAKKRVLKQALTFTFLTFALSWTYWLLVIAAQRHWLIGKIPLTPFGAWAPAVAAFSTALLFGGKTALKQLVQTLSFRLITWKILILSLCLWPILVLFSVGATIPAGYPFVPTNDLPVATIGLSFLEIFVFTALPEEVGWRGYLLPTLLTRYKPLLAAFVVGVIWGVWHIPLFFLTGTAQAEFPFGLFLIAIVSTSYIYTTLFLKTRPFILIAIFLHTSQDVSLSLMPYVWAANSTTNIFWYTYLGLLMTVGLIVIAKNSKYLNLRAEVV